MPAKRDLDPGASPLHFFGAEVRRAREAADMTLADLGALVPCDASTVSKIEAGQLRPTQRFVTACIETFPPLEWLGRFYEESQMWGDGAIPRWFEDWLSAEREAATLRIWQPLLVPGLLQTADYARALFVGERQSLEGDALEELVTARLARQAIFDKPAPPHLWVVLDESVLHRLVGTAKIMHDQLVQLADLAERPCISIQVIPASAGAHAGLACAFLIGSADGEPDLLLVEAIEDQTLRDPEVVRKAAVVFDLVRGDALPRGSSQDLILKVAEGKWNI
jgi:hypothetical protein